MKFELEQEVRVKGTDEIGTVKSFKHEVFLYNGQKSELKRYCVQTGLSYNNKWYTEEMLESYNSYEFDDKFELGLLNFLIDIYLLGNKIDLVKKLYKEKLSYEVK
jgi:hypothetical protein